VVHSRGVRIRAVVTISNSANPVGACERGDRIAYASHAHCRKLSEPCRERSADGGSVSAKEAGHADGQLSAQHRRRAGRDYLLRRFSVAPKQTARAIETLSDRVQKIQQLLLLVALQFDVPVARRYGFAVMLPDGFVHRLCSPSWRNDDWARRPHSGAVLISSGGVCLSDAIAQRPQVVQQQIRIKRHGLAIQRSMLLGPVVMEGTWHVEQPICRNSVWPAFVWVVRGTVGGGQANA
jgi:hypothetical protein